MAKIREYEGEGIVVRYDVRRCGTDGGPQEAPADPGISLAVDGPLYVRGGVEIVDHEGRVVPTDARVALCRCGASKNKPFCDDSHYEIGFKSGEAESSTG